MSRRAFWVLVAFFVGLFTTVAIVGAHTPEAGLVLGLCGSLIGCILAVIVIEP